MQSEISENRLVVRDHTYTVTPQMLGALRSYTMYFSGDLSRKLKDYEEEQEGRELTLDEEARKAKLVASVKAEIERATLIAHDLEHLSEALEHIYIFHYEQWGAMFRRVRLEMGLRRIEDNPTLALTVNRAADFLHEENPHWFKRNKFINFINNSEYR